jgi:cytochrome P450
MDTITGPARVRAALHDPALEVPLAPVANGGIAWLRANVARFSRGEAHRRRRALAVEMLAEVDPVMLRTRAASRAAASPGQDARTVAVEVLAEALGLRVPAAAVATVGRGYHPHLDAGPDTDAAVAQLVEACGGRWDEPTAARIGLLVQACDATALLVDNALRHNGTSDPAGRIAGTLLADPPIRLTRRVRSNGEPVGLDLSELPFGAGAHECPGQEHAIAIACGMLDAAGA